MLRTIQTDRENQILRAKSAKVRRFKQDLQELVRDMRETLTAAQGLGLAAPQIGVNQRVIIINLQPATDYAATTLKAQNFASLRTKFWQQSSGSLVLINPKIVSFSTEQQIGLEGCLSLPDEFGQVARAQRLKVNFCDAKGQPRSGQFSDLNARIIQHEVDHLNGVLFVDRLVAQPRQQASATRNNILNKIDNQPS